MAPARFCQVHLLEVFLHRPHALLPRNTAPKPVVMLLIALAALSLAAPTAQGGMKRDAWPTYAGSDLAAARHGIEAETRDAAADEDAEWDRAYRQALLLWQGGAAQSEAAKILALLKWAAEEGHAPSQNLLGRFHDKGRLMPRNAAEAARWYERAAQQGLASAQLNIGLMYRAGTGVARDEARAFQWFEQAAHQGSSEAQYMVALMLEDGIGTVRNPAAAIGWYTRAAEQGHAPSQHNLAVAYATGAGVARNEAAAVKWYRRAAANGQPKSQLLLARALADGQGVARNRAEAYVWARAAAANGWNDGALRDAATALANRLERTLSPAQLDKARADAEARLKQRG
jgi:TPR repeat protein